MLCVPGALFLFKFIWIWSWLLSLDQTPKRLSTLARGAHMWSRVDISHHCRDSGVWPPADVHSWLGFEYLLIQMDLFAGWKPNDCDLGKKNEVNWNDAHLDFIFSSQKEHSFNYTHSNAEQNIKVCFWPVSNHRRSWWAGQGQSNSPFWITCSFKRVTFLKQEWEIVTMTELSEAKNRQLLISTPPPRVSLWYYCWQRGYC